MCARLCVFMSAGARAPQHRRRSAVAARANGIAPATGRAGVKTRGAREPGRCRSSTGSVANPRHTAHHLVLQPSHTHAWVQHTQTRACVCQAFEEAEWVAVKDALRSVIPRGSWRSLDSFRRYAKLCDAMLHRIRHRISMGTTCRRMMPPVRDPANDICDFYMQVVHACISVCIKSFIEIH